MPDNQPATAQARKESRGRVEFKKEECKGCGLCVEACPPRVIQLAPWLNRYGYHAATYVGEGCTGCGICFYACPEPGAIAVFVLAAPKSAVQMPVAA